MSFNIIFKKIKIELLFFYRIALFNQNNYQSALNVLEEGIKIAEKESNVKRELIEEWINKCKNKLPKQETPKPRETNAQQNETSQQLISVQNPPQFKLVFFLSELLYVLLIKILIIKDMNGIKLNQV
jgi:hypothetical protein